MFLPSRTIENECYAQGFDFVVGIDEAGRGPLCGSVVAGAVMRKNREEEISEKEVRFIRDSKKLSEAQREKAFNIVQKYFLVGVGECDNKTIDRMNILEATMLAMRKAVSQLQQQVRSGEWTMEKGKLKKENKKQKIENEKIQDTQYDRRSIILLVDGNKEMTTSFPQRVVISGDSLEQVISAASIIAKVTRDREMISLHQQFPQYGFNQHKGYGTRIHMNALKKFGPTPIHRMSFRPVLESVTMKRINRELQ